MENKKPFRNHISVVVEKIGVFGGVIMAFLIANADSFAEFITFGFFSEHIESLFLSGVGIVVVLLGVVGYQVAIWSRTWISVIDGSIVIERRTLHQKKNVIGIKNISNVNLEQNVFEMLLGTCKVKLDTNTLTTADSTDVKIVLKKAEAQAFRAEVMAFLTQTKTDAEVEKTVVETWDYEASMWDIMRQGLFSIRLSVVLVAIASLLALVVMMGLTLRQGAILESLGSVFFNVAFFGGIAFSAIRNLVMGFLRYYDFKIVRRGDDLVMRYGLFKKVHYTMPVSTINGLVMYQSVSARLAGYAMAEVVNIGMGDDHAQSEAFLCPYGKREETLSYIRKFLPELAPMVVTSYDRQPRGVWVVWLCQMLLVVMAALALGISGEWLVVYWQQGSIGIEGLALPEAFVIREWIFYLFWGTAVFMVLYALLKRVLCYQTAGSKLGEDAILLVNGYMSRSYCWLRYSNVQYISLVESPPAYVARIQKGRLHILAGVRHQVQMVPYMPKGQGDWLKEKILGHSGDFI